MLGFIIGAPFQSGILATARRRAPVRLRRAAPEVLRSCPRIEAVCERHGVPLAAAALQFPLGHPAVSSVIPGARRRPGRRNVEAFQHPIPADLWAELKHEGLLREDAPVPR